MAIYKGDKLIAGGNLPDQTGQDGKYLKTDGSNVQWASINKGTVTSVNNTQPDANGNVTLTIPDTATWGNITGTLSDQTDLQTALDAKQNTISDLSTIRSGASAGATALQPNDNITELVNNAGYITGITSSDVTTALGYTPVNPTSLATVATSGSYNDLSDKPYIPSGVVVDQTYDPTSTNAQSGIAVAGALTDMQTKSNLVTSVSSSSTNSQYPSAKLFYDTVGNIEALLSEV